MYTFPSPDLNSKFLICKSLQICIYIEPGNESKQAFRHNYIIEMQYVEGTNKTMQSGTVRFIKPNRDPIHL